MERLGEKILAELKKYFVWGRVDKNLTKWDIIFTVIFGTLFLLLIILFGLITGNI